ncbi:hypothetical protein N7461_002832 [Penicillium sp. DV-2018c]|nr:hypothetical protein N7461_002832 [Penicillium sp. DV-2018c]
MGHRTSVSPTPSFKLGSHTVRPYPQPRLVTSSVVAHRTPFNRKSRNQPHPPTFCFFPQQFHRNTATALPTSTTSMASGSFAELLTVPKNKEYKQKVEHSVEPVVVTFLSPLDDKCKAVVSKIEELSNEFTTVKFYQVDVRKHAMLSSALLNTKLPVTVFVKNCTDLLNLGSDVSLSSIREGLQALQMAS